MEPVFELAIHLPAKGSGELRKSLHRQLRAAILNGRLKAGTKLPGTRSLAGQLRISRNTVIAVYDLLFSEGFVVGRGGAGSYVADIQLTSSPPPCTTSLCNADKRLAPFWRVSPALRQGRSYPFDFRPGLPDLTLLPLDVWQRLSNRAARQIGSEQADRFAPQGRLALREAIAGHVAFSRAIACHGEDIIVTSGAQQALDLIARVLIKPGVTEVAVEDPVYPSIPRAFEAAGALVHFVPVDLEGMIVEKIPPSVRVVCVSPSHQFPLGVAMTGRRRAALLNFIRQFGAVIVEDDYDSEFRLAHRPTYDAFQSLDNSRSTIYIGTFSKCLFPELRMGFIVAPPWAREALICAKQVADGCSAALTQDTLAFFLSEGHLARHIRKMRSVYNRRYEALLSAMRRYCSSNLKIIPGTSGAHASAQIQTPLCAINIADTAKSIGIKVWTLDRFSEKNKYWRGFIFGYSNINEENINIAIYKMAKLIRR